MRREASVRVWSRRVGIDASSPGVVCPTGNQSEDDQLHRVGDEPGRGALWQSQLLEELFSEAAMAGCRFAGH